MNFLHQLLCNHGSIFIISYFFGESKVNEVNVLLKGGHALQKLLVFANSERCDDVVWLNVSMNIAHAMYVPQCFCHQESNLDRTLYR